MIEQQTKLQEGEGADYPLKVLIPPIKSQGIKTKIVPRIIKNLKWEGKGKWIEPFLGSGVVLFNINPNRALAADLNPHVIRFYQSVQDRKITPDKVRHFLQTEGQLLRKEGESHYYKVRDRFNEEQNPLDFLFLTRSCFNGMMRFNKSGEFNVPFCKKPNRFRQAYITKIVNQISAIQNRVINRKWNFVSQDWKKTLKQANEEDFVYLDPPYVSRHSTYFNSWSEKDAEELASFCKEKLPCPFIMSMWKENKYRENKHLKKHWKSFDKVSITHYYHVGASEANRNSMQEVLILGDY